MGKLLLSLYVFDTDLLTFDCFKSLLMLSFVPFTFLLFCILFILKSHCMLCLKGKLKGKCMKIKSKIKKRKKVAGIPNICLSCLLQQMLVFKVTFSMKRNKN